MAKTTQIFDPCGCFGKLRSSAETRRSAPMVLVYGVGLEFNMGIWQMLLPFEEHVTVR